jgi:hypothetical protein
MDKREKLSSTVGKFVNCADIFFHTASPCKKALGKPRHSSAYHIHALAGKGGKGDGNKRLFYLFLLFSP